jgi:L-asparaginase II
MLGVMAATSGTRAPRSAAARTAKAPAARASKRVVPPILVRQLRNGVEESVHRGDVVEVDASGRMRHVIGDPDRVVNLRSTVKPFGLLALLRAGGRREFDLTTEELALMTSSHAGEDLHVRTLQAVYRRVGIPQSVLACGTAGSPGDELTAARLARDGERPSAMRHMCSGNHTVLILLAKLGDWPLETYWQAEHPAHVAFSEAVAAAYGVSPDRLVTGLDGCGILTYAFPLREIARAFAILADPSALPADDPRTALADHLLEVRDAMRIHPELVAGTRDRLDTSLMKAADGQVVSKSGMESLRGIGILPGARANGRASGMALKIEDGDENGRATHAATVEALRQAGVLEGQQLRVLARYHRPLETDPHGRTTAEAVPEFELAPVGELIG